MIVWILVEIVVVCSVKRLKVHIVEVSVFLPCDDPFVLHGIRNSESLEDTRSLGDDAVLDCLDAVFYLHLTLHFSDLGRKSLLIVILLSLLLGQRGIPCVVFCDSYLCRVLYIERIELEKFKGILGLDERVSYLGSGG